MKINPFNPQQPAKPNFFVGREQEVKTFTKFLFQTMNNSPMNMSVTGDRGMGKTSLLIKFEQISRENECLTLRLSNYEGNIQNVFELSDFLIDNIQAEILSRSSLQKGLEEIKKFFSGLKAELSVGEVSLNISKNKIVVQELIIRRLNTIWEKIKSDYKAIVLLIDESESLEKINSLTFLREIFQKVQANCNYMVVLAGKLNFPEVMSETFSPLNRFFPAQRLKPLGNNEIDKYVKERLSQTGVTIDHQALKIIKVKSEGHPYVFVSMCYWVFDSLTEIETNITQAVVGRCMEKIIKRLTEDFFAPMIQPLRPATKNVLLNVASKIQDLQFTFKEALKITSIKEPNKLSPYLSELVVKGVITKISRANYKIFHYLFKEYLVNIQKMNRNVYKKYLANHLN